MTVQSSGLVLGSIVRRIGAYLIDTLTVVVALLALTLAGIMSFNEDGLPANGGAVGVMLLTFSAYHLGYLSWRSATPGKMALRIYVAYPDGSPVRPDTAILRTLVLLVEVLVPFGTLANLAIMVFDRERRPIHDRFAGTVVLAGRPGEPHRAGMERDEGH